MYTYRQNVKQVARHTMLKRAVEMLTIERSEACCVRRSYVRDLVDYFSQMEESNEKIEVEKIEGEYIRMWENIHAQNTKPKRVDELTVCYLAGPEPENDFKELISLGVLPNNIWAFEIEKNTYLQALKSIDSTDFFQPKLIKTSIERFFENTPKVFDIVYIDACASLISEQHALRCISTMFRYHRLATPGVLITNFAEIRKNNSELLEEYVDLIAKYNIFKKYRDVVLVNKQQEIIFKNYYSQAVDVIRNDFDTYYGDFITSMVCNAGSIVVPTLRFANSPFLSSLCEIKPNENYVYQFTDVNTIKDNSFYKYIAVNKFLEQSGSKDKGIERSNKLFQELSANWSGYSLLSSFNTIYNLKERGIGVSPKICETTKCFDEGRGMYQFLDKVTSRLFFDSVINQLSCPMHFCTDKAKRLTYVAKGTRMYMDLMVFDECRYIYDWLPAIDQIRNAFSNYSWQYVFRFSLDGLVKQRLNYNNEYFFQGTVVHSSVQEFKAAELEKRIKIN